MPPLKLTKSAIDKIKAPDPSGKQVIHWDTELRGFGLLASGTTTAKSYIAQRRMPDGRTRRLTVGAVGEFERVEDARRKAGVLLAGLREGKDPKAERRKAAARDRTLGASVDLYLSSRKSLSARSIEEYRRSVSRHLDAWLDQPLREITADMVEEKHKAIGKAAGPGAANGAMRALRAVWNHALDRDGTLPANPVRRLKGDGWFPTPPRTRSVRAEQLAGFYKAVDELPNRSAADYLKLLLFTGMRRREATALRWEEIDFATRTIRLPATRTKAGRKLDLPMPLFVRDLLIARRAVGNDGGWVFAADSRSGHLEEPKFALDQVAKASGIVVSAHDLRRTYLTVAESADISPLALKALVNHALGGDVTSGYVQLTTERLREPAQRVADRLMELCGIAAPDGVARIGVPSMTDYDDLMDALNRERDAFAIRLGSLGLTREKARRLIERQYSELPRSERIKMQNTYDLWCVTDMLMEITVHLQRQHPVVTRETIRLLSRVISSLYDISVGAQPALFDVNTQALWHSEGAKPTGSTIAAAAEGGAAVAAHLLASAGSLRDTVAWLDRAASEVGLLDRSGDPVRGLRIVEWRRKFRQERGAVFGLHVFKRGTEYYRATINAPRSDLKTRKVQALARAILFNLATTARGEISIPQR